MTNTEATTANLVDGLTPIGTPLATANGAFNGNYLLGSFYLQAEEGNKTFRVVASIGTGWTDLWHTDQELHVYAGPDEVTECPIEARTRAAIVSAQHSIQTYQDMARTRGDLVRTVRTELSNTREELRIAQSALTAACAERDDWENQGTRLGLAAAWEKFMDIGAETAESHNFCNEYERVGEAIANQLGLEFRGREKDWDVNVDVAGITLQITKTARSESEARDAVEDSDVRDALRNYLDNSWNSVPEWEADSAELA